MSTHITWHNLAKGSRPFGPYLMQVLEVYRGFDTARKDPVTLDEAREALQRSKDPLPTSGCPKLVARYVDQATRYHYMGAAEYEFGAIGGAIRLIADCRDVVTRKFVLPGSSIKPSWYRKHPNYSEPAKKYEREEAKGKKADQKVLAALLAEMEAPPADLTLYYVGPAEYVEHIEPLIKLMAAGKQRNKNSNLFDAIADPVSEYDHEKHGWLCCDFPFFLTKNEDIANRLADLFVDGRKS